MKQQLTMLVFMTTAAFIGCAGGLTATDADRPTPGVFIKIDEPIAIMPFETENALSNLGGQLSDEIIVNILDHAPGLKLIPATVVKNYLLASNLGVTGIPDVHAIHNLKEGLKCKYLLTGNLYISVGEVQYTQSYSDRIASGSVTVRLIDCDSLHVIWAKYVESTYSTYTYYYSGGQQQLSYQTDGQLIQGLMRKLAFEVGRYFYEHN